MTKSLARDSLYLSHLADASVDILTALREQVRTGDDSQHNDSYKTVSATTLADAMDLDGSL
jgi:hypothetical protein